MEWNPKEDFEIEGYLSGPPCKYCVHWKPQHFNDPDKLYDFICCDRQDDINHDFSCFKYGG
jgi:hypothetical protein